MSNMSKELLRNYVQDQKFTNANEIWIYVNIVYTKSLIF